MRWMRERGLPVPHVLEYLHSVETEYLLAEEAIGVPASANEWRNSGARVATALGRGLARIHSTNTTTCPSDRRISRQLEDAHARIDAGLVREDDFDAERLGRRAVDLFAELVAMAPFPEDLVLVHGDFCLPNVLLSESEGDLQVTGLLDCGRAGIGDRHQDLALALRSLSHDLGPDTVAPFLAAYDGPPIDSRALEFFTVLDEFF